MMNTPLGGAIISVFIGLLLGLEREHSQRNDDERLFAGVRTFPLLVVLGYVATLGGAHGFVWVLPVVLLGVAGLAVSSYLRGGARHMGATTETTAILAPLLGALVAWNEELLAGSLAVIVTLLLTLKARLHRIVGAVTQDEIIAILKFGIVAVILAPLLPARPIGPYGALVPRQIGLVVVALTAVSLIGYVLVRIVGGRAGWSLAGLLGGLVSSTAVTLSFSGKARSLSDQTRPLAAGIALASAVLYLRSLVVLSLFDRELAIRLIPAFVFLLFAGLIMGYALVRRASHDAPAEGMRLGNPVELGQALILALLFMAILLGVRFAETRLGTGGLWVTGLIGGLIDVDSVVVATADLRNHGLVSLDAAAANCLLATLANLLLKLAFVIGIGRKALARHVLWPFLALMMLTLMIVALF